MTTSTTPMLSMFLSGGTTSGRSGGRLQEKDITGDSRTRRRREDSYTINYVYFRISHRLYGEKLGPFVPGPTKTRFPLHSQTKSYKTSFRVSTVCSCGTFTLDWRGFVVDRSGRQSPVSDWLLTETDLWGTYPVYDCDRRWSPLLFHSFSFLPYFRLPSEYLVGCGNTSRKYLFSHLSLCLNVSPLSI